MVSGKKIIATLSQVSLGLVLILIWAFMWIRAEVLFPVNTDVWRLKYFLTYILFTAFIFSFDVVRGSKTEEALFKVSFLKRFPLFLISAGISFAFLFAFGFILKGNALPTINQALSNIGLGVLIFHAFMVAILEELVFRGWVLERLPPAMSRRLKILIGTIVFALFHWTLSGEILTLALYIPLGFLFQVVKDRFSPKTNMANSGVHWAWNVFIMGFLS